MAGAVRGAITTHCDLVWTLVVVSAFAAVDRSRVRAGRRLRPPDDLAMLGVR